MRAVGEKRLGMIDGVMDGDAIVVVGFCGCMCGCVYVWVRGGEKVVVFVVVLVMWMFSYVCVWGGLGGGGRLKGGEGRC